jgi:hypothetical protein
VYDEVIFPRKLNNEIFPAPHRKMYVQSKERAVPAQWFRLQAVRASFIPLLFYIAAKGKSTVRKYRDTIPKLSKFCQSPNLNSSRILAKIELYLKISSIPPSNASNR